MGALAARCLALALGCGGAAGLLPLDAYHRLLDAHPLATQSLTNGAIWAASDVIAQARARRPLDPARTARFALTGLGSGVLWSGWFRAVDPAVNHCVHSLLRRLLELLLNCLIEQLNS